jgi:hypothetical protein
MEESSRVLKEWSPVVDALGKGIQSILIRKYPPAYNEFLLYPTYGFSIRKRYSSLYFQPQYHDFVKQSVESKKKEKTTIQFYALVNDVIKVPRTDFQKLKNIQNYYIWSSDHVLTYFSDEKFKEACIWILRIYKLPEPQSIKDLGRGSLTYAKLPSPISTVGSTPVLDDLTFQTMKNAVKQHLERVPALPEDVKKLKETVEELERLLGDKEEKIRQLENLVGPSPVEIVIRKIGSLSELSPEDFEWQLKQAFEGLGFDAKWNGQLKDETPSQSAPPRKPDVEVKAPLAGDPYFVVVEGTKVEEERYQVTEVHGAVDHSKVFPGTPYKTCYRIVIAPRFKKGAIEACEKIDPRYPVMLLTCQDLQEILRFHLEVGGITQEELKHLFDKFEARGEIKREYIEEWEKTIREQRKKLSLALDVYDILYSDKGFMWSRDIWRELKKERGKQGLPLESLQDVHDILKILDTIGAVVVKPSPNGDFEKYDYKAGLTPEGFRLRIRKLEETIRLHESKEPRRGNKLTSWIEDER